MANFDSAEIKATSVRDANNLIAHIRGLYASCKSAQELMARYQAGTDTVFNGAINALYSSAERTEISQMLTQINQLVLSWEADHRGAIGII